MNQELKIKRHRLVRDFIIFLISIAAAIYLQNSSLADRFVGYFSGVYFIPAAFVMGVLFSLTFTAAISTSFFILLSETAHNPFIIAVIGGIGSVVANGIMYKLFHQEIMNDIELLEPKLAKNVAHKIMHSKLFVSFLPYLAALTLISPLPDEFGMLILSGSNFKYTKFFLLSFVMHAIGIFIIVVFGKSII